MDRRKFFQIGAPLGSALAGGSVLAYAAERAVTDAPALDLTSGVEGKDLVFLQRGSSVQRSIGDKLSDVMSVKDFGARGDGTADDTAAIQMALDEASKRGSRVQVPAGRYRVKTLILYEGVTLAGEQTLHNVFPLLGASILVGQPGMDVITFAYDRSERKRDYRNNFELRDLCIDGGRSAIDCGDAGVVGLHISNVRLQSQQEAGIRVHQWIERSYFESLEVLGANYGFYLSNAGRNGNYIDKCMFLNCRLSGKINAVRIDCFQVSKACTWVNLVLNGSGQDAVRLMGACEDWLFINAVTETNGASGPPRRTAIGSMRLGSNILTLDKQSEFARNDHLTVMGAGDGGADLEVLVDAIAGKNLTVSQNAKSEVKKTLITNAQFDEFVLDSATKGSRSGPKRITFIGGFFGTNGAQDRIRYFCNIASTAGSISFEHCQWTLPVYDPQWRASFSGTKGPVRCMSDIRKVGMPYRQLRWGEQMGGPAVYPGVAGQGVVHSLARADSDDHGDEFGEFRVVRTAKEATPLLSVNGNTGTVTLTSDPKLAANFGLGTNVFGAARHALGLANSTVPPTGKIAGGYIFVEDGVLKFRGGNGTVTTLAPA